VPLDALVISIFIHETIPALSSNEIGPVRRVSMSVRPVDDMENNSTFWPLRMESLSEIPEPV